jgi:hypothetical protein
MPLMRSEISFPASSLPPNKRGSSNLVRSRQTCPGVGKELYVNQANLPVLTRSSGGGFSR